MSTYYQDLSKEDIIGKYLDASVYPLIEVKLRVKFERIHDKKQQHGGIDVIAVYSGGRLRIDEKSQLDYINNPIPTCAFEIAYVKNDELREGWLYDKNKLTDRYFYITHIRSRRDDNTIRVPEDVLGCKVLSIDRATFISALENKGIDKQLCKVLSAGHPGPGRIDIPSFPDIYLYRSGQKAEGPLNLVIKRNTIVKMIPSGSKLLWDH